MSYKRNLGSSVSALTMALSAIAVSVSPAYAQTVDGNPGESEELSDENTIVVIGSYLSRKDEEAPVPVLVLDRTDLDNSGQNTITDIARSLTINTGAQFNTDERTQGGTTGTANFNLRGLGVGSTLVLVNGRRRPLSLATTNDGASFVDINALIPLAMVERVEVLKDGAASLYGSDAVAGVVNFVTRRDFEGLEVSGDLRFVGKVRRSRDIGGSLVYGLQGDRGGIVLAVSYLDRSLLTADEQGFTGGAFSVLGNPGAFQPAFKPFVGPGVPLANIPTVVLGSPVADPACGANGGIVTPGAPGSTFCGFLTDSFLTLLADERRIQAGLSAHYEISDRVEINFDASFSDNKSIRLTVPSFPLTSFPFVPLSNPGFVFGSAPGQVVGTLNAVSLPPTFTRGAVFFGRALPFTAEPVRNTFNSQVFWASAGLNFEMSDNWNLDVALTYAHQAFNTVTPDLLADRFVAALEGRGGPNNNQFFNPFGSSIGAVPGSPFFNDPAVIADFSSAQISNATNDFFTIDMVATGTLFTIGGRDVGVAAGFQFRYDQRSLDFNQEANDNRLLFLFGRSDVDSKTDVWAGFVEASWPLADTLELQTAIRFENHQGNIGSSINPKIAALWSPVDYIDVRASFATGFRAPQSTQNNPLSSITSIQAVSDPLNPGGQALFVPVLRVGNPDLKPERSQSYNFGVTIRPFDGLTLRADHWRFTIDDLIVGDAAQVLATGNNPLNVIRIPGVGSIERLEGTFFNAATLKTNGIDFEALLRQDLGSAGALRVDLTATYVLDYKLREFVGGPLVERVDQRNFGTIATSNPDLRGNLSINWTMGAHSLTGIVHYIDSYLNDEPLTRAIPAPGEQIDSWTTFDLQYVVDLQKLTGLGFGSGTSLSIGAVNITDEAPPFAVTENGIPYDTRVHDPRGRVIYVGLKQAF